MSWVSDARSKEGFPKLRSLVIRELNELEEFDEIQEGTMHRLYDFTIVECPNLKKLPSGIQHLKFLHNLELGDMPEDLSKRLRNCDSEAREGGEDHWMVQHIPNIWITKREILDGPIISFENIGHAGHKNKANDQR
ncbi:probable disease resistance protein RF9 [Macadamia integrifolia]|uniref:probable disease resistance protein RF9 n=1 Tax=Macadamia integrifolia TaxID=60698 RepID=UPI001C4F223F|nr:probable disease resistance protein RF9 [Macadamia integrifolia]